MAEIQLVQNVAPHSVTLTSNAKGKVQVEVKVYAETPAAAADAALATLQSLKLRLGSEYANGSS